MDKSLRERTVFHHFLRAVGWPDEESRIESRLPPEPDILYCHPTDGYVAFELTELCSEDVAATISNMDPQDTPFIPTSDPSAAAAAKKLRKHYKSDHPIELLCYNAGRIVSPDDVVCHNVKSQADIHGATFRRIWIYGDVVWLYESGVVRRYSSQ